MINDRNIKEKNEKSQIHPDFEKFLVFNDAPTSTGLIRFVSSLADDPTFKKLLQTGHPYYAELLKNDLLKPVIKVMKGGYAALPHSKFKVYGANPEDKITYRVKALTDL